MQKLSHIIKITVISMCISIALPVFAESAPVYDADNNMQQSMDDATDQSQYLPPPPAPEQQEAGSAFVPAQPTAPAQPIVTVEQQAPVPPPAPTMSMEQRMQRMEQQMINMQNSESAARIESLQS